MPAKRIKKVVDTDKTFNRLKQTPGLRTKNGWSFDDCASEAIKYSSRSEFYLKANRQYQSAARRGWLDLVCGHMGPKGKERFWTLERCWEEALKYKSRADFARKSRFAYFAAKSQKWLNSICGHMMSFKELITYWTFERCQKEALNYNSRSSFQRNSGGAYLSAQKNGWLDVICIHMARLKKPNNYWTKKRCREEALKYKSRSAFALGCRSAYTVSRQNNWLDEFCRHMISRKNIKAYWTLKRCKVEAKKYSTRTDFRTGATGAYSSARENGWLDAICGHMVAQRGRRRKWTFELCRLEAAKFKTRSEFGIYSPSVYQTCRRKKWLDKVCNHMDELKRRRKLERIDEKMKVAENREKSREKKKRVGNTLRKKSWMDDLFSSKESG